MNIWLASLIGVGFVGMLIVATFVPWLAVVLFLAIFFGVNVGMRNSARDGGPARP